MYPRLRDLREDADMTQAQVAKYLQMSQTGYSKYETGENDIPTQVLIKLAALYHTSTDYILGISGKRCALREQCLGRGGRRFWWPPAKIE